MTLPVLRLGPGPYDALTQVRVPINRDLRGWTLMTLGAFLSEHSGDAGVNITGVRGWTTVHTPIHLTGPRPTIRDVQLPRLVLENPHEFVVDINVQADEPDVYGINIICTEAGKPESAGQTAWPPWESPPEGAKVSRSRLHCDIAGPGNGLRLVNYITDEMKDQWRDDLDGSAVNTFANHVHITGRISVRGQAMYAEGFQRLGLMDLHLDCEPHYGLAIGPRCDAWTWLRCSGYAEQNDKEGGPTIECVDGTDPQGVITFIGWRDGELNRALTGHA